MLPVDTTIAFHVTSLDVIHDFWAYQLGVKADANPQPDNVAYTTTRQTGIVTVRCDELCGLWHGAMYNYGRVVPKAQFFAWAKGPSATRRQHEEPAPLRLTYVPDANGADGGYYPDNVDPYSNVGGLRRHGPRGQLRKDDGDHGTRRASSRSEVALPGRRPARPGRPGAAGAARVARPARSAPGARGAVGRLPAFGHWIGNVIASGYEQRRQGSGQNRRGHRPRPVASACVGWLVGIGHAQLSAGQARRTRAAATDYPSTSWTRYFRSTARPQGHRPPVHRSASSSSSSPGACWPWASGRSCSIPTNHVFGPGTYIALVSEHGTIMMMMAPRSSSVRSETGSCL